MRLPRNEILDGSFANAGNRCFLSPIEFCRSGATAYIAGPHEGQCFTFNEKEEPGGEMSQGWEALFRSPHPRLWYCLRQSQAHHINNGSHFPRDTRFLQPWLDLWIWKAGAPLLGGLEMAVPWMLRRLANGDGHVHVEAVQTPEFQSIGIRPRVRRRGMGLCPVPLRAGPVVNLMHKWVAGCDWVMWRGKRR